MEQNPTNMPRSTRKKNKTGTCHVMLRVNTEPPVHSYKKCAMEVKTIGYVFFSFLFLACNNGNKAKEVCENSLDSTLDDKVLLEDAYMCDSNKNSIISEKELRTYNKFQTFNEFKMRGEGKICNNPFVYVKEKRILLLFVFLMTRIELFNISRRMGFGIIIKSLTCRKKECQYKRIAEKNLLEAIIAYSRKTLSWN